MLFKKHDKSSAVYSTHCAMAYPQNGDRIVAIDSVTSLHHMYINTFITTPAASIMESVKHWSGVCPSDAKDAAQ